MMDDFFKYENIPDNLPKEEIKKLFIEYKQGNIAARNKIIEHNIKLVISRLNQRFYSNKLDREELLSMGLIGLIRSVDRFDIYHNTEFSTYAVKCIDREIIRYIQSQQKFNNDISLQEPLGTNQNNDNFCVEDLIKDDFNLEENYEEKEIKEIIRQEISQMPLRSQDIINSYYGLNKKIVSAQELGKKYKVSRANISRIINVEQRKLRNKLKKRGI